jgi:hypothetical protein
MCDPGPVLAKAGIVEDDAADWHRGGVYRRADAPMRPGHHDRPGIGGLEGRDRVDHEDGIVEDGVGGHEGQDPISPAIVAGFGSARHLSAQEAGRTGA